MKKSEVLALIAAKIAGQGTNVDAGSVLPTIFEEIINGDASIAEVDDFEEFGATTSYSAGDIVRYDGKLYRFTANKSAGSWDATKVSQTNVLSILSGMIGALANLETETKTNLVAAINELVADVKTISDFHTPVTVTISALSDASLTAEQAVAAGFDTEALAFLMAAHNPTIEFSEMCVTFNAVESVSEGVVNQTAMFVREVSGTVTVYKAVLTLNSDGTVTYAVDALS